MGCRDGIKYRDIGKDFIGLNLMNPIDASPTFTCVTDDPDNVGDENRTIVKRVGRNDTILKRRSSISTETLHSNLSNSSVYSASSSCSYELDTRCTTPINSLSLWYNERRSPRWPRGYKLSDKIEHFLRKNIAEKSNFRDIESNTLTICSQYSLENHESMASDSDRVHYYRMALFWTGHQEYYNETTKFYASGKRVLEIGTGPMCILAMNAKNAGATRVDALEVNSNAARLAYRLMNAYGMDDVIKIYNVHSKEYWPEDPQIPYDMIVSEIIGDFASQEGLCDVYLDLHLRLLKGDPEAIKKVQYVPMSASTWFTPCTFPDQENVVYKASNYNELTLFSPSLKMFQSIGLRVDNIVLCSEWLPFEQIYLDRDLTLQQCQHKISLFRLDRDRGPMCGFLVGNDIEIRPQEHFGTRFGHCDSWYTNIVLLKSEHDLKMGDVVLVYTVANMKNYVQTGRGFSVTKPSYTFEAFHVKCKMSALTCSIDVPCNCTDVFNSNGGSSDVEREREILNHVEWVEIVDKLGVVLIDYKEQTPAIIPREAKKIKKASLKPEKLKCVPKSSQPK